MLLHRLYRRTTTFACFVIVCAAGQAQSTPEAAVHTFEDAFNSGDMAKADAVISHTGITIIDEFAPYTWTGPKAFDNWGAAFEATSKASEITEPKVTLSAPIVKNVADTQAYLIYPALYTYKQKGVAMRETAHMALALCKEGPTWRIAAWAWTGTVPKVAK